MYPTAASEEGRLGSRQLFAYEPRGLRGSVFAALRVQVEDDSAVRMTVVARRTDRPVYEDDRAFFILCGVCLRQRVCLSVCART